MTSLFVIQVIQTIILAALSVVLFVYNHPVAGSFMMLISAISLTSIKAKLKS